MPGVKQSYDDPLEPAAIRSLQTIDTYLLTGYFMCLEVCLYFSLYCTVVRSNTWLQTRKSVQLESSIIILRENHNNKVLLSHLVQQKAPSASHVYR